MLAHILRQRKGCSRQEGKPAVTKAGDADFAARDFAVQHSLQGRLLKCLGAAADASGEAAEASGEAADESGAAAEASPPDT